MNGSPEGKMPEPLSHPDDIRLLKAIVEGTASITGEAFFQSLARHLAEATGTNFAFVAEFLPSRLACTLAFWSRDRFADNVEWDIRGTPCEEVSNGELCHHPTGAQERFPTTHPLIEMGIESYLGVPLRDASGETLGVLAVLDDRPMPSEPRRLAAFRIFAARAAAELQRLRAERQLLARERSYRELYEEAPLAYIYEDLESRFVHANRAACTLLGIKPEEVVGTPGKSFLAQTPENMKRVNEALQAMKASGKKFSWVELELRRKDNGKPVWVHWWSSPDPDGEHTRTMLVDVTDRVLMAREKARLEQQNIYLREEIQSHHNFEEIIGNDDGLIQLLRNVEALAPSDVTVLILGETGTGKELIARAIHNSSKRKDHPLVKVNCGAIPTGLVESELFGHMKGAFTGALDRRIGRFELADGGTIFLDEVSELPLDTQVKLLRVLQEYEFEPVGSSKTIKVDVRIVAASNRNMEQYVKEGRFRSDLFYRLNVLPLRVPSLRDRRSDIKLLAAFFVDRYAHRLNKNITGLSSKTIDHLTAYDWPGNIRELQNVIERAVVLSSGPVISLGPDLSPKVPTSPDDAVSLGTNKPSSQFSSLSQTERGHIIEVLKYTSWVIGGPQGAAKILGLHPNTLRSRMKKLGITRSSQP